MEPKRIVSAGYDAMAAHYLASKDPNDPIVLQALAQLAAKLPQDASVLDLGCGAGVPSTVWLAERFQATGVDISEQQLLLARQLAPNAEFIQADMGEVDFPAASFDAVTAFYSIIHLPREEQPALLARIHAWIKPGGYFLANWATSDWEGTEENWESWGATMWWSHFDATANLKMLGDAGFAITTAEEITSNGEKWLWALGQVES